MNRSELKARAKESLKGKYGDAILLYFIYVLITFAGGFVVGLFTTSEDLAAILELIVSIAIMGLYLGYYSYFLKVSRNEEVTFKELFNKNNLFWFSIGITLLAGLFVFLWSLLFIIPGIIVAIGYSMVYFVALDNPELGVMDVLKKSKEIMRGHKMDYFVLSLSFVGWALLSIFTFGILYLWLAPYMQVTFANFYNEIKN